MAFAILASSLILVSAAFSRHLNALQLLQRSVLAHRLAEQQLIEAILRQEMGSEIPAQGKEVAFNWQVSVKTVSLEPDLVPDLQMEAVTAQVSWPFRNESRSAQITTALSPQAHDS